MDSARKPAPGLLTIDVGNTDTKLGYFDDAGSLAGTWRVTTARRRTADEYGVLFSAFFSAAHVGLDAVEAIVVASVVPTVDRPLAEGCEKYFGVRPTFFTARAQEVIPVRTERAAEVGADLVAAAIGGVERVGTPAIVINFGTATTYSAVDAAGAFVGAAIAPGLQIAIDALGSRTAKLPQVALEAPGTAIGRDTIAALQSGIIYGAVGQTEHLIARIRSELGGTARVVASGGLAPIIARETKAIDLVEPHLVLYGLRAALRRSPAAR